MSAYFGALALSFFAGVAIALQAPVNAKLGAIIGGALPSSFMTFVVGTLALGALALLMRQMPDVSQFARTEPWMWIGGLLGAYIVFAALLAVPVLGATMLLALIIAGQLVCALVLDHFGIMLPERFPVTAGKLFGVGLLLAGVYIIQKF